MKCVHCGADMYEYQTMCINCGNKIVQNQIVVEQEYVAPTKKVQVIAQEKRLTAFVLALAFGYLGAHCFYLGEKKKGIIRIVTAFIPPIGTILCILDLVKIAKGTYVCDRN